MALVALSLASCRTLNPGVMMKTGKDFKYTNPPANPAYEYKISPNDILEMQVFSNDGFMAVDVTGVNIAQKEGGGKSIEVLVNMDGMVKLPLFGSNIMIDLKGKTLHEAEMFLEQKYTAHINRPYVTLKVQNRRVIVFPGAEGAAKVVPLLNENTTLLEGLAQAGGIAQQGKAWKVKLIRGNLKNPEVYLIDLSTIEGVKKADMVLQANDIIYVEPVLNLSRSVIGEITPYLSFITTAILFYELIIRTTK